MTKNKLISPGEILKRYFLDPMGISAYTVAQVTGITQSVLNRFVHGKNISFLNCLILAKFFKLDDMYWINLQAKYECELLLIKSKKRLSGLKDYQAIEKKSPKTFKIKNNIINGTCQLVGCERKNEGRGLCKKHYIYCKRYDLFSIYGREPYGREKKSIAIDKSVDYLVLPRKGVK